MRSLLVALFLVPFVTDRAGDLDALKVAAKSYVAAMAAVVTLQENSPECAIIASAKAYAATKIAYYDAARAALPTLLQLAKGESADSLDAKELVAIFRGNGVALEAESENVLQIRSHQMPAGLRRDEEREGRVGASEGSCRRLR
jgi:hypothetical protein